jgi:deoxyribodipyrimidine photo-lyase
LRAEAPALVWFRQDLRLADNPALRAAAASKRPLVCVYILDDETPGQWRMGGASRWWLHHSLTALSADLVKLGGDLLLRQGDACTLLPELAREIGADAVYWNRCYEPYAIARDKKLKAALGAAGIEAISSNGSLLHEPWQIKTKTG